MMSPASAETDSMKSLSPPMIRVSCAAAAAAVLHLALPAQAPAQEGRATEAAVPRLEYRLGEDPHDQPLLRRSLILDDQALREIESRVDEHVRRREEKARRERIFFEDIERLDASPFLK